MGNCNSQCLANSSQPKVYQNKEFDLKETLNRGADNPTFIKETSSRTRDSEDGCVVHSKTQVETTVVTLRKRKPSSRGTIVQRVKKYRSSFSENEQDVRMLNKFSPVRMLVAIDLNKYLFTDQPVRSFIVPISENITNHIQGINNFVDELVTLIHNAICILRQRSIFVPQCNAIVVDMWSTKLKVVLDSCDDTGVGRLPNLQKQIVKYAMQFLFHLLLDGSKQIRARKTIQSIISCTTRTPAQFRKESLSLILKEVPRLFVCETKQVQHSDLHNKHREPKMIPSMSIQPKSENQPHGAEEVRLEDIEEFSRGSQIYSDDVAVLDTLGQGACATVYRGLHVPMLQLVALKCINAADPGNFRQLNRELQVTRRLCKESCTPDSLDKFLVLPISAHRSEMDTSSVTLVLEFMGSGSLQEVLDKEGSFSESQIQRMSRDVLEGLRSLHNANIVHRDIKPANVLLNNSGTFKISDFGISAVLEGGDGTLHSNQDDQHGFVGTISYMAPERLRTEPYSCASDIWSFGLCVVACIIGTRPFPANVNYWDMLDEVGQPGTTAQTVVASIVGPDKVSSDCLDFVCQCLSVDPTLRPSAEKLLRHPFLRVTPEHSANSRPVPTSTSDVQLEGIAQLAIRHLLGIGRYRTFNDELSPSMAARKVLNEFRCRQFDSTARPFSVPKGHGGGLTKEGEGQSGHQRSRARSSFGNRIKGDLLHTLRFLRPRSAKNPGTKSYTASVVTSEDESASAPGVPEVLSIPKENLHRLAAALGVGESQVASAFQQAASEDGCRLNIHDGSSDEFELAQTQLEQLLELSDESSETWESNRKTLMNTGFVFLGGSCGSTDWRRLFMTVLREGGVTFFNPQRENYCYELHAPIEKRAKGTCRTLLYVIESCTRATGAMVEAAAALGSGRETIFAVAYPDPDMMINGEQVAEADLNEVLNARLTLLNMIWSARHVELLQVETQQAVQYLISKDITGDLEELSHFVSPRNPKYDVFIGGPEQGDGSGELLESVKQLATDASTKSATLSVEKKWVCAEATDTMNITERIDASLELESKSSVLLYVVPPDARAYSVLTKAAVYGSAGRMLVLVFSESVSRADIVSLSSDRELNDIMRARGFFQQEMSKHQEQGSVFFFDCSQLQEAVQKAFSLSEGAKRASTCKKKRSGPKQKVLQHGGGASKAMVAAVQGTVHKSETAARLIATVSKQVLKRNTPGVTGDQKGKPVCKTDTSFGNSGNAAAIHNAISTDRRASLGDSLLEKRQREAMDAFARKVSVQQSKTKAVPCTMM